MTCRSGITANDMTALLLIEIPKRFPGARVWRRNVGRGVGLDTVKKATALMLRGDVAGAVELLNHRPVTFGVAGEPDIDGIAPVNGYGVRIGVEVKAGRDTIKPEQSAFGEMLHSRGAVYVIARDVEQALADIAHSLERLKEAR